MRTTTPPTDAPPFEPTVLGAMARYRLLVAGVLAASLALGVLYIATRPTKYVATSSLVVSDPRIGSILSGDPAGASEPRRYVADQVAILQSTDVARTAIGLIQDDFPEFRPDVREFSDALEIQSDVEQNSQITVSFTSSDPDVGVRAANAVIEAYTEVRRIEADQNSQAELRQLDDLRAAIDAELAALDTRIAQLGDNPPAGLLFEQQSLLGRRSELDGQRERLVYEARRDSSGIVQSDEALDPPEKAAGGGLRILVLLFVVGLGVAAALAYMLAFRRRQFTTRYQPEQVLRAPLLSDVPAFFEADVELPVLASPTSAAAESFRFAATSIQIQTDSDRGVVTAIVSPNSGDGKSVVSANTALAIAQTGKRTLVIDADAEKQAVTNVLTGGVSVGHGLVDVVNGVRSLDAAVEHVVSRDATHLDLLAFGQRTGQTARALMTSNAPELLDRLLEEARGSYDFVVVDMPPLLRSSLAAVLVSRADRALVVVAHEGMVSDHEELAERLGFIGTPTLGYIYNRAPLRAHWLTPYVEREPAPKRRFRGPAAAS